MRVYLAAPYSMKDVVKARAAELRLYGIEVTSSWLEERHASTVQMQDLTHEEHRGYALQDVMDVVDADILVFHTDSTQAIIRAGRHVEFGIAIGLGLTRSMPIFVVGEERENIFHHLPQVTHFSSWDQVRDKLCFLHSRDVF